VLAVILADGGGLSGETTLEYGEVTRVNRAVVVGIRRGNDTAQGENGVVRRHSANRRRRAR